MYTIRKNKTDITVVNILVYAEDKTILWKYRNLLEQIKLPEEDEDGITYNLKINPILTLSYHTVLEMLSALQGGIDIYMSDCGLEKNAIQFLDKKIQQQYPKCHIITKEEDDYTHSYDMNNWRKITYLRDDPEVLKDELQAIIKELYDE